MADDDVLVFVIDFDDLELHGLVDVDIVVADGFDIDLAAGKEGLDVLEDGDDETAFGAALDITSDDLLVVIGLVDTLPALEDTGFLVAQHELTVAVLLALDIDLNLVAGLQVGVVAQFAGGDDAVALGSHVHHGLAVVDGDDGTLDDILLGEGVEALLIGVIVGIGAVVADFTGFLVEGIPIEICQRLYVLIIHSFWRRKKSSATLFFVCILPCTGSTFLLQHLERQSTSRI